MMQKEGYFWPERCDKRSKWCLIISKKMPFNILRNIHTHYDNNRGGRGGREEERKKRKSRGGGGEKKERKNKNRIDEQDISNKGRIRTREKRKREKTK